MSAGAPGAQVQSAFLFDLVANEVFAAFEVRKGVDMRFVTSTVLLVACMGTAAFVNPVWAQSTTGAIAGNVTDSSGSPVPGAKVSAVNVETNVSRGTTSLQDGSYQILFLPVGTYKIEVNVAGFKKFEQTGVVLEVNRNPKVDAVLQIGT